MPESLDNSLVTSEADARRIFREYTRSSAFKLSLGVQEIRMIRNGWYVNAWSFGPQEMAVMKRLMDKGLLIHERDGEQPKLTQAGKLVRILLHMSGHIVAPPPKQPGGHRRDWSPVEVLNEIYHAFNGGRNAMVWWPGELFQTAEDQAVLALQPKYEGDCEGGRPRRWLIHSDQISHDYGGRTSEERSTPYSSREWEERKES